jgi:short-subunit dehydrogenase
VDALFANAGRGLGHGFLDQDFNDVERVINVNVIGTVYLLHKVMGDMRRQGGGRVLITGSIAGLMPGTYQAVYNATKAFIDSFAYALRQEVKDEGISVTVLMPGPTDTDFFETADLLDTKVGAGKKDDPHTVARAGYEAMLRGDGHEVSGFGNKLQAMMTRGAGRQTARKDARGPGQARNCPIPSLRSQAMATEQLSDSAPTRARKDDKVDDLA